MGVKGLWQIIEKVGVPIDLNALENLVLAIDFSIWLNQSIKGYRDKRGHPVENAHLLGLYQRICKLLYYKIKPVFVFDGGAPYLKRQTIIARNNRKLQSLRKSEKTAERALKTYLSTQVNKPLDDNDKSEPNVRLESTHKILLDDDNLFTLPNIHSEDFNEVTEDDYNVDAIHSNFQNLDNLDIESDTFKAMPPEIRHEILTHLKERRKGWARVHEFPTESNDFSTYQMSNLLNKRKIQENIEKTEEEMQSITESDFYFEWMSENPVKCKSRRMMSDERTHLIYVDKSNPEIQESKSKSIPLSSFKRSENIFGDISDFDYGKSDAIKEDQSSFLQNTSSFSSIKTTKILRKTLENDLKKSITCTVSAPSTYSLSAISPSAADSAVLEHALESDDHLEKSDDVREEKFKKQTQLIKESSVPKDCEFIDLDSSGSFEEVPEIVKPYYPESNTRIELVMDPGEPICVTNSSKVSETVFKKTKDIEFISRKSDSQKEESRESDVIQKTDMNEDSKFIEHSNKDINDNNCSDKFVVEEGRLVENVHCKPDSDKSIEEIKLGESSLSDISPQKQSKEAFTKLREEVRKSPCKKTREGLRRELYTMEREVGRHERHANTVSEQMIVECQELLKLFGIPYVISPMEAEAQCAALENMGLTSGTITDDSDIWLFGGKTVYKNFFTQSKLVEKYSLKDIEEHFKLNRASMICLALLTGSDYTIGVEGVGAVTAVEILSEFNEPGLESLLSFKKWWSQKQSRDKSPGNKTRAKFIKLTLDEGFPNRVVFDAYWSPRVDETPENFSWGTPDLDLLRDFAKRKFGWTQNKIDETLLPVIKRLNERKVQKRIDDYFKCDVRRNGQIAPSKRLVSAFEKMGSASNSTQNSPSKKKLKESTLRQKVKANTTRGRTKRSTNKSSAKNATLSNVKKYIFKGNKKQEAQLKSQLSASSSSEDN